MSFNSQPFSTGFAPSYQGAMWAGLASNARKRSSQDNDFSLQRRQSVRDSSLRRAGLRGQATANQYQLYSGLGDLSNTAYGNQLRRTGGYRDFAIGALSGLMR